MKSTVIITLCILTVIVLIGRQVSAHPTGYGPFKEGRQPKLFPLKECVLLEKHTADGFVRPTTLAYGRKREKDQGTRIRMELMPDTYCVRLTVINSNGQVACAPRVISDSIEWGNFETARSADLNNDGIEDFVAYVWCGGCGLASGYYMLAFVLSSGEVYRVSVVTDLFPGVEDFVDLRNDGSCQFIHTSFIYGERGRDGRKHNYWVYNVFDVKGTELRLANHLLDGFPKWIWYTFKDNHKATMQLTREKKARLWKEQGGDFFWEGPGGWPCRMRGQNGRTFSILTPNVRGGLARI